MALQTFRALPKMPVRLKDHIPKLQQKCTCQFRFIRSYTQNMTTNAKSTSYTPPQLSEYSKDSDMAIRRLLDTSQHYSLKRTTLLKHLLALVADLRRNNLPLSPMVYETLLDAYSSVGNRFKVMPLIQEMDNDGIVPSIPFIHKALKFASGYGDAVLQAKLLDRMQQYGMERTVETYSSVMMCVWKNEEFERSLDILDEMKSLNIEPTIAMYMIVIKLALLNNESTIAFDMLQRAERIGDINDRQWYLTALRCSVLNDEYESVKKNWTKVTKDIQLQPDDGLCKSAMIVAARFNDPQLAYDVLFSVGEFGYPYTDHHFTCLLESFASTSDFKNTFRVFTAMRSAGIIPTKSSATPVAQRLGKDSNAVIQARQALLELRQENDNNGVIDVAVFNMIIHAFAYNGEFNEAMATFEMADQLGVVPDGDTLDALLDACIHQRSATHGEDILKRFQKSNINPSAVSLSKMVTLMCTQDDFEDAFVYLEKIKSMGHVPLRGAYYRLIKKLSASNDPRLGMAIEDMEACGYSLSTHLDDYMDEKALLHEKRERQRLYWMTLEGSAG